MRTARLTKRLYHLVEIEHPVHCFGYNNLHILIRLVLQKRVGHNKHKPNYHAVMIDQEGD